MPPPRRDVSIDAPLVRRLVRAQAPQLADQLPTFEAEGWDNVIYRLGEDFALRLPRRRVAADLLRHEQRWVPEATRHLEVPVPRHVVHGAPGAGYPWSWSVVTWVPGDPADETPLRSDQATPLAQTLQRLHHPAPPNAPSNPVRGVPLAQRHDTMTDRLARLAACSPRPARALQRVWTDALCAPPARSSVWIHGDLHPANVVVRGGGLAGLIDWGDLCAGDAATDLAVAFCLFEDPEDRAALFDAYRATPDQVRRARGWAALLAAALLLAEDPRHRGWSAALVHRLGH